MRPQHNTPEQSFTPEQVAAWIAATERKHATLHRLLAEPLYSTFREQALLQLSDLFKEALEQVRALSETLQANSEALCGCAARLREPSTVRRDRSARARAQRCQEGPSPEEIHEAERPLLDGFKSDGNQAVL